MAGDGRSRNDAEGAAVLPEAPVEAVATALSSTETLPFGTPSQSLREHSAFGASSSVLESEEIQPRSAAEDQTQAHHACFAHVGACDESGSRDLQLARQQPGGMGIVATEGAIQPAATTG